MGVSNGGLVGQRQTPLVTGHWEILRSILFWWGTDIWPHRIPHSNLTASRSRRLHGDICQELRAEHNIPPQGSVRRDTFIINLVLIYFLLAIFMGGLTTAI